MKAFQGYMSQPMRKFDWLNSFGLSTYQSKNRPLVVFGCYKPEDTKIVREHKGPVIVVWMGSDTHKHKQGFDELIKTNIIHVTWVKTIQQELTAEGVTSIFLKLPVKEYPRPKPLMLGNKVYTYLQKSKPEYHGSEVVKSLDLKHSFLIGDHSILQGDWYAGRNNEFYSQAFVGLILGAGSGGAMSIVEMGVRGIKVITNTLSLPNCIPWNTKEDVEDFVKLESENIGLIKTGVIEEMYEHLVELRGCFDLEKLIA